MGQKHSLEDDLITFKLTSKQMARSAKKCDKNMATQTEKLKKAIKDGNMEGAKIYAQNVIREKNQSLNFLRLGSRIDAVASRLETAIRMQDVNKAMAQTVKGMSNAMKSMEVEQIAKTMEEFERQFENMDVRSGKGSLLFHLSHFTLFPRIHGEHHGVYYCYEHPTRASRSTDSGKLCSFFGFFVLSCYGSRWLLLRPV